MSSAVKESKKVIENLKAQFKQGLNKTGEMVFLEVYLNDDLKKILKKVIINEETDTNNLLIGYRERGEVEETKTFIRYKVKRIVFNNLYNQPDYLFIKKLLDDGKFKFEFYELNRLEVFKSHFKENMQKTISLLMGLDIVQNITFTSKPQ